MVASMVGDRVEPVSPVWYDRAFAHLDTLTKPLRSLGRLEEIAARIVAIQQTDTPSFGRKAVFVFASDHGVAAEGVSAYPSAVTEQMVLNFLRGGAAINVLARAAGADVHVVDVGVNATIDHPTLISRKVRRGSRNFRHEPALTQQELETALDIGRALAEQAHTDGVQLVAIGEMGIANTTSASAITAALCGKDADEVTGTGTGIEGQRLLNKKQVVADALAQHFGDYRQRRPDPSAILSCIGGLEIAAMTAFIESAAARRLVIVVDGFISSAAAAIACLIEPATRDYLFAGHESHEIGHRFLLEIIGQKPLLQFDMRLGEGTGAVLAFPILEAAVRIYNEMATFASAGVSEAIRA